MYKKKGDVFVKSKRKQDLKCHYTHETKPRNLKILKKKMNNESLLNTWR